MKVMLCWNKILVLYMKSFLKWQTFLSCWKFPEFENSDFLFIFCNTRIIGFWFEGFVIVALWTQYAMILYDSLDDSKIQGCQHGQLNPIR